MGPRLLKIHLFSGLPDSAVFLEEEVKQAAVFDLHVRIIVNILAHVI